MFEELCSDYLALVQSRGKSLVTVRNYRDTLSRLRAWLEQEKPEALEDVTCITHRLLQRWLGDASQRLAPASVDKLYRDARVFFAWLVEEEELRVTPMSRVERPSAPVKPVPVIDPGDLAKMLGAPARNKVTRARNVALLLLLIDTGIRAGELLEMKPDDFDWARGTVIVSGKTGTRVVPFSDETHFALRKYRRVRKPGDRFWGLSRGGLRGAINRICDASGVPRVDVKTFRHTFAHLFLLNGGDVLSLQAIGGWASVQMLEATYGRSGRDARALVVHSRVSPVKLLRQK